MSNFQLPARVQSRLRAQGDLVSAARRVRGLTQSDLAERAGTSRPTIYRMESGKPNVAWSTVITVCWLLDIPTDPELMDPILRTELLSGAASVQRAHSSSAQELDDNF